jgi:hypothetical protein
MNRKIATLAAAVLSLSIFMTSCKKDHDDHNHDEEELITKVKLKVFKQSALIGEYVWDDADGDGGNAPKIDTIKLKAADSTYRVNVEFSNPEEDMTMVIREEKDEHELYYENKEGLNLSYTIIDKDSKGRNLGLESDWKIQNTDDGKVKITLKHKPGSKGDNDLVTKGETDIQVEFPVKVE